MKYLVGLAVGGIMENPKVTYENIETIEAESPEDARRSYNLRHNCHYYYGEVLGEVEQDLPKRRKGTPREDYEPLYNCENWIP